RLQLHKHGKNVTLLSKNGNDFTSRFTDIKSAATLIPTKSVILDCELTACADDGTRLRRPSPQAGRATVHLGVRHPRTQWKRPPHSQALGPAPEAEQAHGPRLFAGDPMLAGVFRLPCSTQG